MENLHIISLLISQINPYFYIPNYKKPIDKQKTNNSQNNTHNNINEINHSENISNINYNIIRINELEKQLIN